LQNIESFILSKLLHRFQAHFAYVVSFCGHCYRTVLVDTGPALSPNTLTTRSSFCYCPCCVTTGLFTMHLLYTILSFSFSLLLQSTTCSSCQSHRSAHHTSPHHIASQQYSHLNRTTFAAALLFTRSRSLRFRSLFLLLFILLSGDIELNPGPSAFTLCTLNIRSVLHLVRS